MSDKTAKIAKGVAAIRLISDSFARSFLINMKATVSTPNAKWAKTMRPISDVTHHLYFIEQSWCMRTIKNVWTMHAMTVLNAMERKSDQCPTSSKAGLK